MLGAIFAGIGGLFSGIMNLGSGIFSALFGGQAAVPVMAGGEMGSLSAASMAGGAGGVGGFLPDFAGMAVSSLGQIYVQKAAIKRQARTAEKIAARELAVQRELASRQLELTEKQMELQAGQQMIGTLTGIYDRQNRQEIRSITVPVVQREESSIERINRAIGEFLGA
jgi:hypothetical protein